MNINAEANRITSRQDVDSATFREEIRTVLENTYQAGLVEGARQVEDIVIKELRQVFRIPTMHEDDKYKISIK